MRTSVKGALERYLRHAPTKTSKSKIKKLKGISRPQYRLRVDDIRIFYDVDANFVEILAIISKSDAIEWLKRAEKHEASSIDEHEG